MSGEKGVGKGDWPVKREDNLGSWRVVFFFWRRLLRILRVCMG